MIDQASVAAYLQQHPEFFLQHPELLATLQIPHQPGAAISLIEHQVKVLREENQQLQQQISDLIDAATRNEQLNQRIQNVLKALLKAENLDHFFEIVYQEVELEFATDSVSLRLFDTPWLAQEYQRPECVDYDAEVHTLFAEVLESQRTRCGSLSKAQQAYLFPEHDIASAVLIPLVLPKPQGILALGSIEATRYTQNMGTELLDYLGEMLSQLLQLWQRQAQKNRVS